jgi:hypothetical protein
MVEEEEEVSEPAVAPESTEPSEPLVGETPDPRPWITDLGQAPRDGALLELKMSDGTVRIAMWRSTRSRATPPTRGWELRTFLADPITRYEIKEQVTAWRRPEGFLTDYVRGRM